MSHFTGLMARHGINSVHCLSLVDASTVVPALAEAARTVGSPQIRAAGTLGGNLGTCSPAGDGLPVLFALDAVIHLQSSESSRVLPVHDFMLGVKRNARASNEIITAVTIPLLDGWQGYAKVGVRNAMVISVASACLAVDKSTKSVRIALGAVGPTIIRCRYAEAWLAEQFDPSASTGIDVAIAKEFGRFNVTANAVTLGLIATAHTDPVWLETNREKIVRQYPLRRIGESEDVAPMVLFLASKQASWITGQVVSVNGGFAMV
jgi:CO/xanthine dehydrogenase FAD-binding subunit